jgi:hypothetical protein
MCDGTVVWVCVGASKTRVSVSSEHRVLKKKRTKRTVAFTVEKQIKMNKPNGSVVVDEGLYHFGTKGGESHGANDGGTTTFGNAGGGGGGGGVGGVGVGGVGVGGDGGHVEGLVW